MSIDQVYPSSPSSPEWSILLAEALDSSGGSAGDGINITVTPTSPANKHVWISTNYFERELNTKDETGVIPGGTSFTTHLGQTYWKAKIGRSIIPLSDEDECELLREQIQEWMTDGNNQSSTDKVIFFAVRRKNSSGNWRWKRWRTRGSKQNWLRAKIMKYKEYSKNSEIRFDLQILES